MSGTVTITIENGIQAGRSLSLPVGRHSAGSAPDNKLVVADASVAEAHFILDVGAKPALIAIDSDIVFENGKTLAAGSTRAIKLPARFTAGDTQFFVAAAAEGFTARRGFRLATPLALVASVLGFLIFQGMVSRSSDAFQPAVPLSLRTSSLTKPKSAAEQTADAISALKTQMFSVGITSVKVSSDAANTIQLAGDVPVQQQQVWQNIRQWFDATYGTRYTVVDKISLSAPAAPLAIAAVRFGGEPFVVDQAGQKLFIGSQTSSGWTVDKISDNSVTLHKDSQTAAVNF